CSGNTLYQRHVAASTDEAGHSHLSEAERARIRTPEERDRLIASPDVDQVARDQAVPLERLSVPHETRLVLHSTVEIVEDESRHAAPRDPSQIVDVDGLTDLHGCPSGTMRMGPATVRPRARQQPHFIYTRIGRREHRWFVCVAATASALSYAPCARMRVAGRCLHNCERAFLS